MPSKPRKPTPAGATSGQSQGGEPPDGATRAIRDAIRAYVPDAIQELARDGAVDQRAITVFDPAQPRDPDGRWSGGGSSL